MEKNSVACNGTLGAADRSKSRIAPGIVRYFTASTLPYSPSGDWPEAPLADQLGGLVLPAF